MQAQAGSLPRTLGRAASLGGVFAVAHLHAREGGAGAVAGQEVHDVSIAVTVPRVVVPGRELCRMRPGLEPPVHAR